MLGAKKKLPTRMAAKSAIDNKHTTALMRLNAELVHYVLPRNMGCVLPFPFRVILSRELVVLPDIFFIHKERVGLIEKNGLRGAPDVIVEVLAPKTRNEDLGPKRRLYSRSAVQEYWIVDPEFKTIELLLWSELGYASTGIRGTSDSLTSSALPGFALAVNRIFEYS